MSRPKFSSNFAAILAIAGAAIGLGNVWRFPYMMGSYGGTAFLLIYLLFVILFAIPALVGEWSLGREARGGTITAFTFAIGPRWGRVIGYILVVGITISASYYIVIISNIGYTAFFSITHGFGPTEIALYSTGLSHGLTQYLISIATLMGILYVAYRGVNNGIEKVSNVIVPFFFVVMLYLIYSTFQLEGSTEKMLEYLQPDFKKITWKSLFAALGQAIFSMGLGGTVMLIYGSYLPDRSRLFPSAIGAALADTIAALLAALFVFPTILVFGVDQESGPRLLFETLPNLFGQMLGGRLFGSFFLLALFLIAFLSGLAALEVIIGSVSDDVKKSKLTRKRCIIFFGLFETLIIALPAFKPELISVMDLIFGTGLLASGCAVAIIALTWFVKKDRAIVQFKLGNIATNLVYYWLKFVTPLVFLVIFLGFIFSWDDA